jgi:hypothetical protein
MNNTSSIPHASFSGVRYFFGGEQFENGVYRHSLARRGMGRRKAENLVYVRDACPEIHIALQSGVEQNGGLCR